MTLQTYEKLLALTLDKNIGKLVKKGLLEKNETTAGFVVMQFMRREIAKLYLKGLRR